MINRLLLATSNSFNPHHNLALEEALFELVDNETLVFYLWQNEHTVVIGRNQNAYKECKVVELQEQKGSLARRLSGGGAVYHDLGNLNFTFLMSSDNYDLNKQNHVLITALNNLGIDAYAKGRNDLLIDGKKFSGHAYYHHNKKSYQHGTLMVNVNFNELSKFLNVSRQKLQGKGVKSVVSRVTNIIDYNPNVTIESLKSALIDAIQEVYQLPIEPITNYPSINHLVQRYSSDEWLLNPNFDASYETSNRFDWGEITILLSIANHKIVEVEVYTDAMDTNLPKEIKHALQDETFSDASIEVAIESLDLPNDMILDLKSLFIQKENPFN